MWAALAIALGLYALMVAALYFGQRSLIFPAPGQQAPLPAGFEQVSIPTVDGLSLQAAYKPAVKDRLTAVFFHGNGDNWGGASVATAGLAAAGYGILLPEYRGYSGNPGQPTEEGFYKDGRAALEWLRAQGIGGERLVIIGNSIGAGVAVQMATETQPLALMLVSPFESMARLAGEKFRWFPARWLVRDHFDNRVKIGRIGSPILILHDVDDALIPVGHAKDLAAASPHAKLILFAGTGHQLAYQDNAQAAAVDWLEKLPD